MSARTRFIGIDFSGSKIPGKKIWISEATTNSSHNLVLLRCLPISELSGCGRDLDSCLRILREFITKAQDAIVGLDFPFGLPNQVTSGSDWNDMLVEFQKYETPRDFKDDCLRLGNQRECKRLTDKEKSTPFSPYNLRIYRQTFHGIRAILAPLIEENKVCVLPMQPPIEGKPWLIEICPASTLKKYGESASYKGRDRNYTYARKQILDWIERSTPLTIQEPSLREKIILNHPGDALDSVLATRAAFHAAKTISITPTLREYLCEGFVFI